MITPLAGEHIYVNGKEVSILEFQMYDSLYNLIVEAPSYYRIGTKKIVPVSTNLTYEINDTMSISDGFEDEGEQDE